MRKQKYSSADTSINSTKTASAFKKINLEGKKFLTTDVANMPILQKIFA